MTNTARKIWLVVLFGIGVAAIMWIDLFAGPRALATEEPVAVLPAPVAPVAHTRPEHSMPVPPAPVPVLKPSPKVVAPLPARDSLTDQPHDDALYFASMSKHLAERDRGILDKIAERIGPNTIVFLKGHTDYRGDEDYNQGLSKDRADVAASYLIKRGVPAAHVKTSFVGKQDARETIESDLWRDRRVDVRITEGDSE